MQRIIENEPFDHFRTGSVSLLIGLLVGNSLLSLSSIERRRFSAAIFVSSALVIASTFLGVSALAVQPILILIAVYGCCVAASGLRTGPGQHT